MADETCGGSRKSAGGLDAHASGFDSTLRFFYLNEFSTLGDAAGVASYDSSTTDKRVKRGYSSAMQQRAGVDVRGLAAGVSFL